MTSSGHAIEARLYAEDPERGFLPSTGTLAHLRLPGTDRDDPYPAGVVVGERTTRSRSDAGEGVRLGAGSAPRCSGCAGARRDRDRRARGTPSSSHARRPRGIRRRAGGDGVVEENAADSARAAPRRGRRRAGDRVLLAAAPPALGGGDQRRRRAGAIRSRPGIGSTSGGSTTSAIRRCVCARPASRSRSMPRPMALAGDCGSRDASGSAPPRSWRCAARVELDGASARSREHRRARRSAPRVHRDAPVPCTADRSGGDRGVRGPGPATR